jgi:hypothetical protein
MVEHWITLAKKGKLGGNYGIPETNALRDGLQHAPGVKNGMNSFLKVPGSSLVLSHD